MSTEEKKKKKVLNFLKQRRETEFVCPFRGPCNVSWDKDDNSKFNKHLYKLIQNGYYYLCHTQIDKQTWTRIAFHAKFWQYQVKKNPKFLNFVSNNAVRPIKDPVTRIINDKPQEFFIVWLTFLSDHQPTLLKCFEL